MDVQASKKYTTQASTEEERRLREADLLAAQRQWAIEVAQEREIPASSYALGLVESSAEAGKNPSVRVVFARNQKWSGVLGVSIAPEHALHAPVEGHSDGKVAKKFVQHRLSALEALYLVDCGHLELFDPGLNGDDPCPLSLQLAYSSLLREPESFAHYQAFKALHMQGHVAVPSPLAGFVFDVYDKERRKHFRKTNPGVPDARVLVMQGEHRPPSVRAFACAVQQSAPVRVLCCAVSEGGILLWTALSAVGSPAKST